MAQHTDLTPTARLRADILNATFAPGERLTEAALADRYSVGRGTVRGALLELRAEGLVDIEPNRGAVVRRISLEEAIEIAEARKVLEALVAARAASNRDPAAKETLLEIVDEMRDSVAAGDNARYSELNRLLHGRIWEISQHRVAKELVANLRDRSAHHQFRLAVMPGRSEESLHEHVAIVDAIVTGDDQGAERAMREHLTSVIEVLSSWSEMGIRV
ncbi:MAG TPA: GntR family transcriptional regulator [Acidimicrobiia bacterium]